MMRFHDDRKGLGIVVLKNLFQSKVIKSFKKVYWRTLAMLIAVRKREDSLREGKSVIKVER